MALRLSTGLRNKLMGLRTTIGDNPTFDSDTTGWTASDATLSAESSGGQSNGHLRVTETGSANPGQAYQDFDTVIGRVYVFRVYFKKGTADTGSILIGTTGDPDAIWDSTGLSDAGWTLYERAFLATATTTRITLQTDDATAGEYSDFDEAELDEVLDGAKEIFRGSKLAVYSGSQPTDADSAATGTLLFTISLNGGATGLSFENAASGVLVKATAETWQGTAVASGTAGWCRLYEEGDDPSLASTVFARIDGNAGTSGAQLNMSNTAVTSGAVQSVSAFSLTLPASGS